MGDFIAQCLWVDLININKATYNRLVLLSVHWSVHFHENIYKCHTLCYDRELSLH